MIRVKEESEKASLKLSIHKTKIVASVAITSWQIEKVETVTDFIFLASKCDVYMEKCTVPKRTTWQMFTW